MKFTLTLAEATKIIRTHFSLSVDINIEITETEAPTIPAGLTRLIGVIEAYIHNGAGVNKIAAIKEYRGAGLVNNPYNLTPVGVIGLREAKDVVEHWEEAKRLMLSTGQLVRSVYVDNAPFGSDNIRFMPVR